ncbi:MAG TPA: hypothetical protein VH186_01175 [Chloroflexia bacterium]|nr:hypothetical protein [Chloroflexia bacterium]
MHQKQTAKLEQAQAEHPQVEETVATEAAPATSGNRFHPREQNLTPARVLSLQRQVGNQAVMRMLNASRQVQRELSVLEHVEPGKRGYVNPDTNPHLMHNPGITDGAAVAVGFMFQRAENPNPAVANQQPPEPDFSGLDALFPEPAQPANNAPVAPQQNVGAPPLVAQPQTGLQNSAPGINNAPGVNSAPVVNTAPVVNNVPVNNAPIVNTAPVVNSQPIVNTAPVVNNTQSVQTGTQPPVKMAWGTSAPANTAPAIPLSTLKQRASGNLNSTHNRFMGAAGANPSQAVQAILAQAVNYRQQTDQQIQTATDETALKAVETQITTTYNQFAANLSARIKQEIAPSEPQDIAAFINSTQPIPLGFKVSLDHTYQCSFEKGGDFSGEYHLEGRQANWVIHVHRLKTGKINPERGVGVKLRSQATDAVATHKVNNYDRLDAVGAPKQDTNMGSSFKPRGHNRINDTKIFKFFRDNGRLPQPGEM